MSVSTQEINIEDEAMDVEEDELDALEEEDDSMFDQEESELDLSSNINVDDIVCGVCKQEGDVDETFLLCDTCDGGEHQSCSNLKVIPKGKWNCKDCKRQLALSRQHQREYATRPFVNYDREIEASEERSRQRKVSRALRLPILPLIAPILQPIINRAAVPIAPLFASPTELIIEKPNMDIPMIAPMFASPAKLIIEEPQRVIPILPPIIRAPKAQECKLECAKNFQLQPHQCRVAQALQKQRGVIAIHAVGSGKTRLAVASAKCFLQANTNGLVIVITPNVSIKQNFEKQLLALENLNPAIPNYSVFTQLLFQGSKSEPLAELKSIKAISSNKKSIFVLTQGFLTTLPSSGFKAELSTLSRPYMLIVDEAHNARNTENNLYRELYNLSKIASKILLLSATPLVNSPVDIIPLIGLIDENAFEAFFKVDDNKIKFKNEYFKNCLADDKGDLLNSTLYNKLLDTLNGYARCIVSIYRVGGQELLGYPQTNVLEQYFTMDDTQLTAYEHEENKKEDAKGKVVSNMFSNRTRAAGFTLKNEAGENQKLEYVKRLIDSMQSKDNQQKLVLYSFFVEGENSLINQVKNYFNNDTTKYAEIVGYVGGETRRQAVEDFNSGKKRVLLISASGSEGIDLSFATDIVITEPSWNEAANIQVIGRAVRNKSHLVDKTKSHENTEGRPFVTVHKLFLIKPTDVPYIFCAKDRVPARVEVNGKGHKISADLWMKLTSETKQVINNTFLDHLITTDSIETLNDCTLIPDLASLTIHNQEVVGVEHWRDNVAITDKSCNEQELQEQNGAVVVLINGKNKQTSLLNPSNKSSAQNQGGGGGVMLPQAYRPRTEAPSMINDEKYRELIAKQLGIEPSELIPIEQLAIVRPGPTWKDVYDYIISGNDAPGYLKVTKK